MNLFSNAIKYNRDQGHFRVVLSAPRERLVRFAVADTGRGMTVDQMSRLFTPFERLGADATQVEGTGLGLAVVKGLVQAMGGQIGVDSVVDTGSTFWVDLPEGDSTRTAAAVSPADAGTGRVETGTLTVLYIEDNPANTFLVEATLRRRPAVQLATAATGAAGIAQAIAIRPGVILLDLNLPDMSGTDVLARLRAETTLAGIPIVVLSADATAGSKERLLAAGAAAYLTKPLNLKRLLKLIDELSTV
jgi:CheY-like chemotaxis protein